MDMYLDEHNLGPDIAWFMSPYESVCEPIKAWCEKNYYTDFIVTIFVGDHETTEFLEFDAGRVDFTWATDWWEGEKDVRLLGFAPIGEIKLHNYSGITNADKIRAMSDEELAKWITDDLIEPGYMEDEKTYKLWLDWLRQEVTYG